MFEQIIEFSFNHPLLVGAFAALVLMVIFNEFRVAGNGVSTAQAVRLMNREEAIALDIRDRKEYSAGHITGSLNIPLANLDSRISELDKYKDKKILVVCKMGNSAAMATAKLQKAGFPEVLRLKGGMMQWQTDAMPVVKK